MENKLMELISSLESSDINIIEYQVVLLVNSQTNIHKKHLKYINYSDSTEDFSSEELITIFTNIQQLGLYVDIVYDELTFMNNYFEDKYVNDKLIVYNLCRNGNGRTKKSFIPSFCEFFSIMYTSSDSLAVSLLRNKYLYSNLLTSLNINTPATYLLNDDFKFHKSLFECDKKYIIKPTYESASQGISNSSIIENNDSTYIEGLPTNGKYIVQEFIEGYEIEVPFVIDDKLEPYILGYIGISINKRKNLENLIITETISETYEYKFYDALQIIESFNCKQYIDNTIKSIVSCIGMKNYGRVDFRINEQGVAYVTDISTTPYMIEHSSFKFAMNQQSLKYHEIFKYILLNTIYEN